MKVKLKYHPEDRGTKKLKNQTGDKLVCVRSQYEPAAKKQYKPVELTCDEIPSTPQPSTDNNKLTFIDWYEKVVRETKKRHEGHWDTYKKLWKLDYDTVKKPAPESRIRNE